MGESESMPLAASNFRPDKNVTKKFDRGGERILFSDLVALAAPGDKPEVWLADRTGHDPRTARRWLADKHRRPEIALAVVLGEIMLRLD
jgi:hypothetical protein